MAVIDFAKQEREAKDVKGLLKRRGLPSDFGSAIQMLAGTIRDHKHLEVLLTSCGPEERQLLYDGIRAHLRFTPKALDQYVASAGQMAERQKLPVIAPDGSLHAFQPARDVSSAVQDAENAIAAGLAKRILTVTCSKCAAEAQFPQIGDETRVAVVIKARKAGWVYDPVGDCEICPDCPTSLRTIQ